MHSKSQKKWRVPSARNLRFNPISTNFPPEQKQNENQPKDKTQMKALTIVLTASALAFGGCASGPKFADYTAKLPPPKQGYGRICVYRPGRYFGCAIQPSVAIDGRIIGDLKSGGFVHADRPAGDYTVECVDTPHPHGCHVSLAPQSTKYVRVDIRPGVWVGEFAPEEASATTALSELAELNANN